MNDTGLCKFKIFFPCWKLDWHFCNIPILIGIQIYMNIVTTLAYHADTVALDMSLHFCVGQIDSVSQIGGKKKNNPRNFREKSSTALE